MIVSRYILVAFFKVSHSVYIYIVRIRSSFRYIFEIRFVGRGMTVVDPFCSRI